MKPKQNIRKQILIGCITLLCLLILSPLYTNMLIGFTDSRTNNRALIRLKNETKTKIILSSTANKDGFSSFKKKQGKNPTILEAKINSQWKEFNIEIRALKSENLLLELLGPSEQITGSDYPIIVDYRNLQVGKQVIFKELKHIRSNKPYHYVIPMKAGEHITIKMQIRKHHFSFPALAKTYQFEKGVFISILILSFLFAYKIVQYISKFKIIENNSRIDIVFVIMFILMLFIPMSHMTQGDKSEKENRMLTTYQPLFKNNKLNLEYGKQFEGWFNDRFFARKPLINLYSKLTLHFNKYGKNRKAGIFKDDWILIKEEEKSTITEKDISQIDEGIKAYLGFCKRNNIKCYIEIVPRKLEFIKDKTFRIIPQTEKDKAKIIADKIKEKQNYEIVYPLNELQKANKKDLVFFKTDHHWTEWGAYIGYKALMKKIREDYPRMKAVTENDYDIFYNNQAKGDYERTFFVGSACMLLHLRDKDCPLKVPYRYYRHKNEDKLHVEKNEHLCNKNFYYNEAPNPQKVMIIGNSFTENFGRFSPYAFPVVYNRRTNNREENNLKLSRWKKEILKNKVDIVAIVISSEYSDHLADLKN